MSLLRRAAVRSFGGLSGVGLGGGNPWVIPTNGQLADIEYGGPVNPQAAMQMAAVSACVRIISSTVSGLPLMAVDSNGRNLPSQPKIIADPFGGESSGDPTLPAKREGLRQTMVALLTYGNAFMIATDSDGRRNPKELTLLDPSRVSARIDENGDPQYMVNGTPVPTTAMWHLRGMTWPGSLLGISPIEYARRTIGLGISAEAYGSQFFRRGASMSGVIEMKDAKTKEQASSIAKNFEASHSGLANSHAVGVLTGGAEWKQITISPEDAQFLGTQAAKTLDVAMLYGVPPHMLGQVDRSTSWGKGIEEQTLGFTKFTVKSWTDSIEDLFSRMLPRPQRVKFNYDDLLRPDTTTRYQAYLLARTAATLSPNEIREKEGLDPKEGGDDLMAPLNSAHTNDPGWNLDNQDAPGPESDTSESDEQENPDV